MYFKKNLTFYVSLACEPNSASLDWQYLPSPPREGVLICSCFCHKWLYVLCREHGHCFASLLMTPPLCPPFLIVYYNLIRSEIPPFSTSNGAAPYQAVGVLKFLLANAENKETISAFSNFSLPQSNADKKKKTVKSRWKSGMYNLCLTCYLKRSLGRHVEKETSTEESDPSLGRSVLPFLYGARLALPGLWCLHHPSSHSHTLIYDRTRYLMLSLCCHNEGVRYRWKWSLVIFETGHHKKEMWMRSTKLAHFLYNKGKLLIQ